MNQEKYRDRRSWGFMDSGRFCCVLTEALMRWGIIIIMFACLKTKQANRISMKPFAQDENDDSNAALSAWI